MDEFLTTLQDNWFLVGTFATLVAGWVRFEMVQKNFRDKNKDQEKELVSLKLDLATEVKNMSHHAKRVAELKTNIEWVKSSLSRLERNMDQFMITYQPPQKQK